MRIVGGKHRGRRLFSPTGFLTRPTSDRARQALFNILEHAPWAMGAFDGLKVLDAFCGTGAFGLEALSRGASCAFFMDHHRAALDVARQNAESLGESKSCSFFLTDVLRPPEAPVACDLVYVDPPYGQNLAGHAVIALKKKGWISPGGLVVVETAVTDPWPSLLDNMEVLDSRAYGKAQIRFLRLKVNDA